MTLKSTLPYKSSDAWSPEIDEELRVVISSFHADDAFQNVFGNGRQISKESISWQLIRLAIHSRLNPTGKTISVRNGPRLVALLSGSSFRAPTIYEVLRGGYIRGRMLRHFKPVNSDDSVKRYIESLREAYGSTEDEVFQERTIQYFKQLHDNQEADWIDSGSFRITVIAVDPNEQGRGHLNVLLNTLLAMLRKDARIKCLTVSTYDESKVRIYCRLGFSLLHKHEGSDLNSWILSLPIKR